MKVVLASDLHASDRPPSSCTDTYPGDMLDLLAQCVVLANNLSAPLVLAGDIFHLKAPGRTSHRLVQALIIVLRGCKQGAWVVPGNHDIQHDAIDTLLVTQPLGVLIRSGAARLLDGWGGVPGGQPAPNPFFPVYGVPWQQHWDNKHVFDALQEFRDYQAHSAVPALVVAHAPLYPPGQELPYEFYPSATWADAMCGGQCFYGHVHEPHGVWASRGTSGAEPEVTFCNNGALSRGSLHEYNLIRDVGATVWDSETGLFDFVRLQARPASEVFRLAEHEQATDMQGRLDEFLAGIAGTDLAVVSVESVLEHMRSLNLDNRDMSLIEELLTEASHA